MSFRNRYTLLFFLLASLAKAAWAEPIDATGRARTHYEAGRALYNLGNYSDAAREFLAGYQLSPRREFLINLGQTYRKLNDLQRAHAMYVKYIDEAPADDPRRDQVKKLLADVDQKIRENGDVPGAPSTVDPVPVPSASPAPSPSPTPTANNAVTSTTDPPKKKPFIKRHWWIIPVSLVAAAGIGVGIYFAVRPPDACAGAEIACINAKNMSLLGATP